MNEFLDSLVTALDAEKKWEEEEHRRLEKMTFKERIACGFSFPSMRLERHEINRHGMELVLSTGRKGCLHDGIQKGDSVRIAPPDRPERGLEGLLKDVDESGCFIWVKRGREVPRWLLHGEVCVSRRLDGRTWIRFFEGLKRADRHESLLKSALLGDWRSATSEKSDPIWLGLNSSQARAAQTALDMDALSIIHGPPGTGKTTVLISLIRAWKKRKLKVWGLADSNAAVDHICRKAIAEGIPVLRMGSQFRIAPDILEFSLEGRMEKHPSRSALVSIERDILRSEGRERGLLIREKKKLKTTMEKDIIENSEVICSTLGSMARLAVDLPDADVAIIDEATQAIEPAIWSVVPHVKKMTLIGDPCQLGPSLTQPGNPLGRSMLERLLDLEGADAPMLEIQHRMNEEIMEMLKPVYGEKYRCHPAVKNHRLTDLTYVQQDPLSQAGKIWVDMSSAGSEEVRDPVSMSIYNPDEIELTVVLAGQLQKLGVKKEDLGIITPYSAQTVRLRALLPEIEIDTVNAFQGREKEAIICTFVRANERGELGFVADPRRLTVAMSRARRLWVGIGDSSTLAGSKEFKSMFSTIPEHRWLSFWDFPATE